MEEGGIKCLPRRELEIVEVPSFFIESVRESENIKVGRSDGNDARLWFPHHVNPNHLPQPNHKTKHISSNTFA